MSTADSRSRPNHLGESFTWEKDRYFRYIRCNENYAMAAGLDSPSSIVGKSDDQMPWRELADFFRTGDQGVMSGQGLDRILVQEKEIMADGEADILVTEKQLLNKSGECVGLTGHFLDITGRTLRNTAGFYSIERKRLYLGDAFGNEYLTRAEARVLEKILMGWTAVRISDDFCRSKRTIDRHLENMKKKLQCKTKGDLINTIVSNGVHLTLYDCASLLVPLKS